MLVSDARRMTHSLLALGAALDALNNFRDTPFGKVRLNVPSAIAPFVLGRVMGLLVKANPQLQVEIVATDRLVDIVEEGFDAGVRYSDGDTSAGTPESTGLMTCHLFADRTIGRFHGGRSRRHGMPQIHEIIAIAILHAVRGKPPNRRCHIRVRCRTA